LVFFSAEKNKEINNMNNKNKILIIASGGREHALGWKLKQSPKVEKIYFAPGTVGTEEIGESTGIAALNFDALTQFAIKNKIDLTVAAPDDILAAGIVNAFQKKGLKIFGPTQEASKIEWSKAFAKELMREEKIPTAKYKTFKDAESARRYVKKQSLPVVIKASGLALGKGVVIANDLEEALNAIEDAMVRKVFGEAGSEVVIEEFLKGGEVSIHAFSDGKTFSLFPTARDHKPIFDGNKGPNTGGMGTIAPVPGITKKDMETISEKIVKPVLEGLSKRGTAFTGCLYPGLMMTKTGPKVVEFNSRFGDPEMESYMRLLESDLFEILNACAEGNLDRIKIKWSEQSACCIVLASAGYPASSHKGDIIKNLDKYKRDKDIKVFHFATKEEDGNIVTNGGRVLGVTAVGKNLSTALKKAYSAIGPNGIHFEGMQVRSDIGKL
jgi:phosphoribosylamine---glycine ligase